MAHKVLDLAQQICAEAGYPNTPVQFDESEAPTWHSNDLGIFLPTRVDSWPLNNLRMGVLHELGHVVLRHHPWLRLYKQRMVLVDIGLLILFLGGLVVVRSWLSWSPGEFIDLCLFVTAIAVTGVPGRRIEYAADRWAFLNVAWPKDMGPDDWGRHLNLVNHLEGTSGDSGFFFAPFSTHPSHRQRVQALRRLRKHSEVAAPPVPPL